MRIAAVDMGSNSFHMVVVEAHPDGSFDTLLREKEMLRLGDVVTRTGTLGEDDVDRVVETLRRFVTMAEGVGADEIVACATSALREADNSADVVDLIAEETGIRVDVISGRREAQMIFSAVRASIDLNPGPAVCFDLGGGSLEVMVGDHDGLHWATSLHLGVARLAAEFLTEDPPTPRDLRRLERRITEVLAPVAKEVGQLEPGLMVGTSGTLCDLAQMAAASRTGTAPASVNQLTARRRDIQEVHERLITLPASGRARLTGIDARRADQIPVGSLFLVTAMKLFGFSSITVGDWALREGIVLDAIRTHEVSELSGDAEGVRRSSVLGLARRCNWDEPHATQVARLAVGLFDSLQPLHGLGPHDRELLESAALLHDIGEHVAIDGHHKHTAYLIENGRLRGFSPEDVAVLATLGRYHRRSAPKSSYEPFAQLSASRKADLLALLALLRLADGLDRGHAGVVDDVNVELGKERVRLLLVGQGDMDLELWGLRRKRELFEKVFDRKVEFAAADHPSLSARNG